MFRPREDMVAAGGAAFGRARFVIASPRQLSLTATTVLSVAPHRSLHSPHPFARRWDSWCLWFKNWARHCPLALDLAEDIGSAKWLRGTLTLIALLMFALAFWPSFTSLEPASLIPLEETTQAEFRSQSLKPMTAGATQGRHFAPTEGVIRLSAAPERATIHINATIGENDSLLRMLQRGGLGVGDASQVSAMVASAVPLAEIPAGTRFDITLGKRIAISDPRPLAALHVRPRFDLALAIVRRGSALFLQRLPIAVDTSPLRIRGPVGASLYRSARAAGAPAGAVQDYLRTIDAYLPFEDISSTDEFDLVVSYKRTADGQGEVGNLLYAGVLRGGKSRLQLLRWGRDGGFYTPDAMSGSSQQGSSMLGAPVAGHITSGYGLRRHPILGYVRMHGGIDFAASWGSPIYAANNGTVSYAGWHGGHGNYVRLDHGEGISTGYGHMSRFAVSPGMSVQRGQVIGYVGSTGLSTGPHLHYELYRGGQNVDPLSVSMLVRRTAVDAGQLVAFNARLKEMLSVKVGLVR